MFIQTSSTFFPHSAQLQTGREHNKTENESPQNFRRRSLDRKAGCSQNASVKTRNVRCVSPLSILTQGHFCSNTVLINSHREQFGVIRLGWTAASDGWGADHSRATSAGGEMANGSAQQVSRSTRATLHRQQGRWRQHRINPDPAREVVGIFSYTPEPHIAFCTIFVHPLFAVFEHHVQKWVIFVRRRRLSKMSVSFLFS